MCAIKNYGGAGRKWLWLI